MDRHWSTWNYVGPLNLAFTFCVQAKFDLEKITYDDAISGSEVWNDISLMDTRMQIAGQVYLLDASDISKRTMMNLWRPKESKLGTKYFQVLQITLQNVDVELSIVIFEGNIPEPQLALLVDMQTHFVVFIIYLKLMLHSEVMLLCLGILGDEVLRLTVTRLTEQ